MRIEIIEFDNELAHHFESINREWIEDMFTLEPLDEFIIQNPIESVIAPGGAIWFAKTKDAGVCATCAIMRKQDGTFELTKMGVSAAARGQKVGEALLQHTLNEAKKRNFTPLYLLTNSDCQAAIHLYRKNGFVDDNSLLNSAGKNYQRCNIAMRYNY